MKNKISSKSKTIILIALFYFLCTSAFAAPTINSISGTFSNGSALNLNGSFGSMDGSIVSWDNFEAHPVGTDLSNRTLKPIIGPTWSTFKLGNDPVAINSQRSHSGTKSVIVDWGDSTINSFGWTGQGPFNRLYITYWRYQEGNYIVGTCNHKQFYLYGNNNQMPQNMPLIPDGQSAWGYYNNVGDGSVPFNLRLNMNSTGWTYTNTSNQFQRWEFYTQLNSPYTLSNGIVKVWLNGKLGIENYSFRHRYVDGEFIDFRLGHMAQGFASTARAWFDDLYISTTQARVEIGNNAVFNNCTLREIQAPTNWSNNSITFTSNQGAFSAGQTAYLFVVNSAGEASPGYRITIGQSTNGGTTTPTPTDDTPTQDDSTTTTDSNTSAGSAWSADTQTGDSVWKNSGVTYCVRLLVQGSQVNQGANQVRLAFQGRSSGNYTIRNVSIAERDTASSEGNVIDSTWKQVTFDKTAWSTSATIAQGSEKLSDPVSINFKTGSDYYVTFKIDTPSVYLNPGSTYRELFFISEDHTSDKDWAGNGHGVANDFHALSKIYTYEGQGVTAPGNLRIME